MDGRPQNVHRLDVLVVLLESDKKCYVNKAAASLSFAVCLSQSAAPTSLSPPALSLFFLVGPSSHFAPARKALDPRRLRLRAFAFAARQDALVRGACMHEPV